MDWIVHLLTNVNFINFMLFLVIFGGFTALGRGIKWLVKAASGHALQKKNIELQAEQERGKNLERQIELEKLRSQPKAVHPLTVDDVAPVNSYTYDGYPSQVQEQEM